MYLRPCHLVLVGLYSIIVTFLFCKNTKNSGNRNKKIETQKLRAKRVFIAGEAISPPPWAYLATFIVPNVQGTISGSLLGHKHWWFWKKKKCKNVFFLSSTLMAKHEKAKVNTWHVPWGLFFDVNIAFYNLMFVFMALPPRFGWSLFNYCNFFFCKNTNEVVNLMVQCTLFDWK